MTDVVFQENCATHGLTEHYIILEHYHFKHHIVKVKYWCAQCGKFDTYDVYCESWHINIWKDFLRNIDTNDN
jgi:hypothetical protein